MPKIKINITIDENLLNDVDDYCDRNYLNRSALFSQSVLKTINEQKVIDSIKDVSSAVKTAVIKGAIDEDTQKKLEAFEALSSIYIK